MSTRSSAGQKRRPTGGISGGKSLVRPRGYDRSLRAAGSCPGRSGAWSPNIRARAEAGGHVFSREFVAIMHPHAAGGASSSTVLSSMRRQAGRQTGHGLQLTLIVQVDQPLDEERRQPRANIGLLAKRRRACCCWLMACTATVMVGRVSAWAMAKRGQCGGASEAPQHGTARQVQHDLVPLACFEPGRGGAVMGERAVRMP